MRLFQNSDFTSISKIRTWHVISVSFSPDGKTLVSGSDDNTIKLWDVETGQEIRTLKGHDSFVTSVNFSPDGKTLVSGSWDKTIKLWNVETGQEIRTLKGMITLSGALILVPTARLW